MNEMNLSTKSIEKVREKINKCAENLLNYEKNGDFEQLKDAYFTLNQGLLILRNYCIFLPQNIHKNEFLCPENMQIRALKNNIIRFDFIPISNFRTTKKRGGKEVSKTYECIEFDYKNSIRNFVIDKKIKPSKQKMCLCIFNIVSEDVNPAVIPDTDNRQYQGFINLVKIYFLKDDNFSNLSILADTVRLGNKNKTIAYLVPQEQFAADYSFIYNDLQHL